MPPAALILILVGAMLAHRRPMTMQELRGVYNWVCTPFHYLRDWWRARYQRQQQPRNPLQKCRPGEGEVAGAAAESAATTTAPTLDGFVPWAAWAAAGGPGTGNVLPLSPITVGSPRDYIPSTRFNVPSPAAIALLSQGWDEPDFTDGRNGDGALTDAEGVDPEPLPAAQPPAGLYGTDE